MVATRTNAIEPQLDETVKNWVTTQLNENVDQFNNMMNEFMRTQQYLVVDVTCLKNREGASRFSRLVDDLREEDKIKIVSIHIYDRALAWHLQYVRTQGENVTWSVYKEDILKRFREVNQDRMAELKNLRYKTTMKQYQIDFETLLNQVEITKSQYVSMYIAGLPPSMEMHVSPNEREDLKENLETRLGEEVESPNAIGKLLLSECYDSPQILLNDISGVPTYNTIRMKAIVTKHLLHLLMDTCSTHNFLDLFTAKKLGCKLTKTYPLQVTVAKGNKMVSQYTVYNFKWSIQGYQFKIDVMLLPLGGCEMVLGIQWLSTLGNIQWNFHDLVMRFVYEGQKVFLRGTKQSELQWINGKQLQKGEYPLELQSLLEEFKDVFVIPIDLPPKRSSDHNIPLKDESNMVNIRPYKYPPNQKDVIETMVIELLDSGVIRESHSLFSSPIMEGKLFTILTALPSNEFMEAIYFMWTTDPVLSDSLPMSQGKSTILVVVDRLSKQAHFIAVTHPYTTKIIAQIFLDNIYKLYGLPKTIVSGRDKVFMSLFWQSLFKMLKVGLKFSIAYHPQTDGQTKVVNKCLEGYLRCMTGESPKDWVQWLPLAEYWYNTNYHSPTNTTPFEAVYGQPPPLHIPYMSKDSKVELVDRTLTVREKTIDLLKFNLEKAQNMIKVQADKHMTEREFLVGDWVYLKLQPYRQLTVRKGKQHKLSSKFYGPYMVLARIG
uniref:Putative mitochondrial protein n=1 Tax=Tanacetum cinerariifolium TaxID=118510 RepID=A0A6L2MK79_TANCI|nr:putative mitochondrial protein [Tanacetum cinerariifolium]